MAELTHLDEKLAEVLGLAQQAHLASVREHALRLAAEQDPTEEA